MSTKDTPLLFLLFVSMLFSFNTSKLFCQNTNTTSIYDWYDNKVGKENLDINKGRILLNYDKSIEGNNRFFFDKYYFGTVKFDNQIYNNILLNYDAYKDELIINPNNESGSDVILLTKEKVDYFSLNDKKYVNINYNDFKTPDFIKGFYEEKIIGANFILYIKNIKNRKDLIVGDKLFDDFNSSTHYYLKYNEQFYEISSKKSIVTILPEYKKMINEFYSKNQLVEKSSKVKFFEDLLTYLNTLIK
jgi:hypothetical protein